MKKHAIKSLAILFALIVLCASANQTCFAQTQNSINEDEQRRLQLVAALERAQTEVKAARKYVDGLKEQVKLKERQIDALNKRDEKRVEIQSALERQIDDLKNAVAAQKEALKIKQDEADYLQKEIKKLQKKLKSSHTREKIFGATTAILFLLLIFK